MRDLPAIERPIPFRVLVDESLKLARHHFRSVYPSVAAPVALLTALVVTAQLLWMGSFAGAVAPTPDQLLPGFAATVLFGLAVGVVQSLGYAALLAAMTDAAGGAQPVIGDAWRFVFRGSSLGTFALNGLVFAVSLLLCCFPAIYTGLVLAFTVPVMRAEGLTGAAALRRSRDLVTYNPARAFADNPIVKVFLILLIGGVVTYAASFLVQLPFVVVMQVMTFRHVLEQGANANPYAAMGGVIWLQLPSTVLGTLAGTAVNVYTSAMLAKFHRDTVARKEGRDLEAAIAALEPEAGQTAPQA